MQIYDAAGTASALYDLVTHNRLAGQLADAWDKQHPDDMPIVKACEKLAHDWKKMVWKSRLASVLDGAIPLVFIFGICGILFGIYQITVAGPFPPLLFGSILLGLTVFLLSKWEKKVRRQINAYCKLGQPLQNANCAIRVLYDDYKNYGDVHDLMQVLDDMCLEIVRLEKLGLGEELKFNNPFPKSYHCDMLKRTVIDVKSLRNCFTDLVNRVSYLGLTTGDLKIHFKKAERRWVASCQMTDFQI